MKLSLTKQKIKYKIKCVYVAVSLDERRWLYKVHVK